MTKLDDAQLEADPERKVVLAKELGSQSSGSSSTEHVPKAVLVDLLAHASSAARIVAHLDDRHGSTRLERLSAHGSTRLERLSVHVDALVHGLRELLGEPLTAEVAQDGDETDMVDELRRLMARADALASTTNDQFSRVVVLTDGDDRRDFKRLAHLVEMTALAVSAASEASTKLTNTIERPFVQERT